MIVHFMASKGTIAEQLKYYKNITNSIRSEGHTLASDWIDKMHGVITNPEENPIDWKAFDKEQNDAVGNADVVVAEITQGGFFVGYRLAQAIQQKKPILLLFRDKAFAQKSSFAGAKELNANGDFIRTEEYNEDNLTPILRSFFEENILSSKDRRFNFYLDPVLYKYLRQKSYRTGKSKAEIVREVMYKEIEKED